MSAVAAAAAAPSVRPQPLFLSLSVLASRVRAPFERERCPPPSSPPGFLLYSLKDPPAAEGGRC